MATSHFESTADAIKSAAARIGRDNGVTDMVGDVTAYVKAHPVQVLIGALAVGFLAGRMLRR